MVKTEKKTFLNLEILMKTIGRFLFRKLVKTCYELNNYFVHQIKHPIMNLRFFCYENEFQIKVNCLFLKTVFCTIFNLHNLVVYSADVS